MIEVVSLHVTLMRTCLVENEQQDLLTQEFLNLPEAGLCNNSNLVSFIM